MAHKAMKPARRRKPRIFNTAFAARCRIFASTLHKFFDGASVVGCCKIKARMQERALTLNSPATRLRLIRCGCIKGQSGDGGGLKRWYFFQPIRPVDILNLAVGKNTACLAR